ncbi:folate-binding protein YgfZ [Cryobacterium sp. PAMC25264]|uniref:CAF17-like 4Fe-4S cluster assembly/insertion protein YgfZ n=1 Tax=Cryobacterium sp. PAMC25264 TaxID=2861288 RepID=UPI001C635272|nr:folate-binding protein [Cryobacterium sp. PAMC25264]QYF72534.1 folate-binding protein [Cryobacterium sp. PAMC25264]
MSTAAPSVPAAISPLLSLDGAVGAEGIDAGVAAHYGGPNAEQRRLLGGTAVVDLSHRGVLSISGPDRLTWLNSMSSQELRGLTPGQSTETLLLDPSGHLEYAIALVDDGVESWLLIEAAELPGLHAWLDRMRFTLRVQVVDHTLAYATIGTMAADPATVALTPASPNGVPLVWHDPWNAVTPGGWQYAAETAHPGAAWQWSEVLIDRSALPELRDAVAAGTVAAAGLLALEALRIAAWRPRGALDADERTIPHELDWLRTAVHLNKGCYRGQETIAKVHNLGHPPRRLVLLHLDGSDSVLPAHGDEVQGDRFVAGGEPERRTVGTITSSAIHYELGPIALAVIKRTVPGSVTLHVLSQGLSITASQEVIVPESAGSVAEIPRLPRLGVRAPRG